MCILSLPDWSPSVLHRSILFIMDNAPQNEVPKAVQVVCNKTITVLLSIQILNFVNEMSYFLAHKFQSQLVLKKVHLMS